MSDLKVGDKVKAFLDEHGDFVELATANFNYYFEVLSGTIKDMKDSPETVNVEWNQETQDNSGIGDETSDVPLTCLKQEVEFDKFYASLEYEYDNIGLTINAKVDEAAKILDEAIKLAESINSKLCDVEDGTLYRTMSKAGWRMSSLNC